VFNDFFGTTGTLKETDDVQADENIKVYIGNDIFVYVTNMSADKLEFEISGIAETTPTEYSSSFV